MDGRFIANRLIFGFEDKLDFDLFKKCILLRKGHPQNATNLCVGYNVHFGYTSERRGLKKKNSGSSFPTKKV